MDKKENLAAILKEARREEDVLYAISDYESKVLMFWKIEGGSRRRLMEDQRSIAGRIREWPGEDKKILISRESGMELWGEKLVEEVISLTDLQWWFPDKQIFLYYDYEEQLRNRRAEYLCAPETEDFSSLEKTEEALENMMALLKTMMPDKKHLNKSLLLFLARCAERLKNGDWEELPFYENLAQKKTLMEKKEFVLSNIRKLWNQKEAYTGKSPEIRKAIRYLEVHFSEDISLGEIAAYVDLSENYFSNLFKTETGVNLTYYINVLRISRAKELMDSTNWKVYEIAEAVGYKNPAYFSTIFRKITKVSVSEYRKAESVKNERKR